MGLVQLHGYAPQSAEGKARQRPIEQKESYRWLEGFAEAMEIAALIPNTRVISVADREADMFELFDYRRRQTGRKAELLIRAKTDRCLEATHRKLFDELAAAPLAGSVSITVPRHAAMCTTLAPTDPTDPKSARRVSAASSEPLIWAVQ